VRALIPTSRTKWNTLSREDQIAWSKISESAKKTMLGTPDNEKGRDVNPVAVVNNHEMIFEGKEENEPTQSHTSSNRNVVANVHQSDPARRTIQANTSTLRSTEESKHQEPKERGLLYMATHKMTKSNKQIEVNNAFSKAVERKSTNHVTWENDIEQPTTKRYKKPELRAFMANRTKVAFNDDGTIVEPPDDEEQPASGQVIATPRIVGTPPSTRATTCGNNTQLRPTMNDAPGRGRGRGRTPGSHYFGAGGQCCPGNQGGRRSRAPTPDGRTHLILRSMRNAPPQPSVNEPYIPGVNARQLVTNSIARRPRRPMVSFPAPDMLPGIENDLVSVMMVHLLMTKWTPQATHMPWYHAVLNQTQLSVSRQLLLLVTQRKTIRALQ